MSTLKVNKIEATGTTDGGIEIDSDGHVQLDGVQLPTAGPLSNRNIVINGAMQFAQRAETSTSQHVQTADRFGPAWGGDAVLACTQSRETLSSGDPYNEGFRHFLRLKNTATSSDNGAYAQMRYKIEAQDLAKSGWHYTSSSSFVTCSFWVRLSIAGTYYVQYRAMDTGNRFFNRSFTVAANTWTKVSHTIPGDSSLVINNDNGNGFEIVIVAHYGSTYQGSNASIGSWFSLSGTDYFPASIYSQDWTGTADATMDWTGVQLEVGSMATPFEHRSHANELARCQRYYWKTEDYHWLYHVSSSHAYVRCPVFYPVEMREDPAITIAGWGGSAGSSNGVQAVTKKKAIFYVNDPGSALVSLVLGTQFSSEL